MGCHPSHWRTRSFLRWFFKKHHQPFITIYTTNHNSVSFPIKNCDCWFSHEKLWVFPWKMVISHSKWPSVWMGESMSSLPVSKAWVAMWISRTPRQVKRHAGHGTASGERRKKRWKISKITMLFMGKSQFFMGNQLCIAMLFMENYGKLWKCINYGKNCGKHWKTIWKKLWKITMLFMGKLTISTGPFSIANCIAM